MREFKEKIYWPHVSQYQTLSENFIEHFQHEVIWIKICQFQKLFEPFIREFIEEMYWGQICQHQYLSLIFQSLLYFFCLDKLGF